MSSAVVLLDARLDTASEGASYILKTPRTSQYQTYLSPRISTSTATAGITSHQVTGALQPDTLLVNRPRIKADLIFQPKFTWAKGGTLTNAQVLLKTTPVRDVAVGQWPLHAQIKSMQLSLGQVQSTYDESDFAIYSRLARQNERAAETCACLPETTQWNMSGGSNPNETVYGASVTRTIASTRALWQSDPNGDACFSNGLGDGTLPNTASCPIELCNIFGSTLTGAQAAIDENYTAVNGSAQILTWSLSYADTGIGCFGVPTIILTVKTVAGASPTFLPTTVFNCPWYYKITSCEALKMPPFYVNSLATTCLPAIPHIATFNLKADAITAVVNALAPTSGYLYPLFTAFGDLAFVGINNFAVHMEFIGSATSVPVTSLAFTPWTDIQRFVSVPQGLPWSFPQSSSTKPSRQRQTLEILLPPYSYVPDYLFIRVRPDAAVSGATRCYGSPLRTHLYSYPIDALNIKLENNVWGTQVSQERLYEMTVRNGYDVSWDVFTGSGLGAGALESTLPVTVGATAALAAGPRFRTQMGVPNVTAKSSCFPWDVIPTLGSGVLLKMGTDVQLAPNSSPGVAKPLRMSVVVTFYQTTPASVVVQDPATPLTNTTTSVASTGDMGLAQIVVHAFTRQQMISSPGTNRILTSSVLPGSVEAAAPNFTDSIIDAPDACSDSLCGPGYAFTQVQSDQFSSAASFAGNLTAPAGPGVAAPAVWGPG